MARILCSALTVFALCLSRLIVPGAGATPDPAQACQQGGYAN